MTRSASGSIVDCVQSENKHDKSMFLLIIFKFQLLRDTEAENLNDKNAIKLLLARPPSTLTWTISVFFC